MNSIINRPVDQIYNFSSFYLLVANVCSESSLKTSLHFKGLYLSISAEKLDIQLTEPGYLELKT